MSRRGMRRSAAVAALALLGAASSDVRLEVSADRRAITVGDPITLTVRLVYPQGSKVASFVPEAALGDLALLGSARQPAKGLDLGREEEVRTLRVTAYKPGTLAIPALEAKVVDPAGKEQTVTSEPIPFEVTSILSAQDKEPADIKKPVSMPESLLWPFLAAGLLALGLLAWFGWRRRRRSAAGAVAAPTLPPRPAHEVAYAELERLLSAGLLEAGRLKEFYIELSEIMRRYVEARYGIETLDRTTWEILEAVRAAKIALRVSTGLGEFFGACDLVKFAKYLPRPEETRATVEMAYRLVDESRAAPSPPSEAPAMALATGGGS
ncbi:MAG TPA: BatD family protein [Candidatus Polarisedimenticolia bacterium]|nr:BatD family protein [Candidatus Polarisedimenticolia bacterium]